MTVGQRALLVWIWVLITLIFLIVFLDGGLDHEPLIFFVLLWAFDLCALTTVIVRYNKVAELRLGRAARNEIAAIFAIDMPKLNLTQCLHCASIILSKLAFEVLVCLEIRNRIGIHLLFLMLPLWTFLALLIIDLTAQVFDIHRKLL